MGTDSAPLPRACQAVAAAAKSSGLDIAIRLMDASTRTAEEAAAACGCEVGQIVKSLVFQSKESGRPILLLVSGANRVKESAVAREIGEKILRPDADFVREQTGFAIGGIPPLGHARPLETWFDKALLQYSVVHAAAGTPNAIFAVDPNELLKACAAKAITVHE
ncbi:MAG: YbaK/EbsC family protein [Nitratireductor sp.]|jgi:prolyl-tRNA editing enzyme YbaK/EbsC (Cys-tRNA(Pro) deacylase)|nr:YbaK/EbsC family protein [Nitratireductor sp.]